MHTATFSYIKLHEMASLLRTENIKELYRGHRRRIRVKARFTEWMNCEWGLRQGCVLSPLLFAIFIAELGERLRQLGEGERLGEVLIPGLAFADDVAMLAGKTGGSLRQLGDCTSLMRRGS
jgi:hypothetical protein